MIFPFVSKNKRTQAGFGLMETVVYVSIVSFSMIFITMSLFSMVNTYRKVHVLSDVTNAGSVALERMTRELRQASSIDNAVSMFGSNPGTLMLNTINISGTPTTVKFYVSSGALQVDEGGVYKGSLTGNNVAVTNLVFRNIATTTSAAVKIELQLQGGNGSSLHTANFYDTAVLRGSYQ